MAVFTTTGAFPRAPWSEGQVIPTETVIRSDSYGSISLGKLPKKAKGMIEDLLYGWDINRYMEREEKKKGKRGVPETPVPGGGVRLAYPQATALEYSLDDTTAAQAAYALSMKEMEEHGYDINHVSLGKLKDIARSRGVSSKDLEDGTLFGLETANGKLYIRHDLPVVDIQEALVTLGHEAYGHAEGEGAARAYEPIFRERQMRKVRGLSRKDQKLLLKDFQRLYSQLYADLSRN